MPRLLSVPQGGTAVGTGLNRHPDFDRVFCERLSALTGLDFTPNPNKFEGMGAHDAFVELSGVLNTIAVSLNKIGNDIRLLGSGPRAGIAELIIPDGRAVLLDHARQDQPDAVRGADHGLRPGDGQPRRHHHRRCAELPGAQRVQAADHPQHRCNPAGCWPTPRRASRVNMVDRLEPNRAAHRREPREVARCW